MATDLTDVFLSIFFVTVVRSFSPGVGFKDMAGALRTTAGLIGFFGFAARGAAAALAAAIALRPTTERVESAPLRAAAALADFAPD
ncbi:hypothetical protein RZS28_12255 [Methylocapsa polymorpha]|uniref:Uncharacterized protein n=1 Tax=Methylocapsa polymorpha TaxID=3080828 RepID=A0ABZ0HRN5_9HYPH|nr:hypothetical protein RZS28_12255 [Methylocapsa sp. RX1]